LSSQIRSMLGINCDSWPSDIPSACSDMVYCEEHKEECFPYEVEPTFFPDADNYAGDDEFQDFNNDNIRDYHAVELGNPDRPLYKIINGEPRPYRVRVLDIKKLKDIMDGSGYLSYADYDEVSAETIHPFAQRSLCGIANNLDHDNDKDGMDGDLADYTQGITKFDDDPNTGVEKPLVIPEFSWADLFRNPDLSDRDQECMPPLDPDTVLNRQWTYGGLAVVGMVGTVAGVGAIIGATFGPLVSSTTMAGIDTGLGVLGGVLLVASGSASECAAALGEFWNDVYLPSVSNLVLEKWYRLEPEKIGNDVFCAPYDAGGGCAKSLAFYEKCGEAGAYVIDIGQASVAVKMLATMSLGTKLGSSYARWGTKFFGDQWLDKKMIELMKYSGGATRKVVTDIDVLVDLGKGKKITIPRGTNVEATQGTLPQWMEGAFNLNAENARIARKLKKPGGEDFSNLLFAVKEGVAGSNGVSITALKLSPDKKAVAIAMSEGLKETSSPSAIITAMMGTAKVNKGRLSRFMSDEKFWEEFRKAYDRADAEQIIMDCKACAAKLGGVRFDEPNKLIVKHTDDLPVGEEREFIESMMDEVSEGIYEAGHVEPLRETVKIGDDLIDTRIITAEAAAEAAETAELRAFLNEQLELLKNEDVEFTMNTHPGTTFKGSVEAKAGDDTDLVLKFKSNGGVEVEVDSVSELSARGVKPSESVMNNPPVGFSTEDLAKFENDIDTVLKSTQGLEEDIKLAAKQCQAGECETGSIYVPVAKENPRLRYLDKDGTYRDDLFAGKHFDEVVDLLADHERALRTIENVAENNIGKADGFLKAKLERTISDVDSIEFDEIRWTNRQQIKDLDDMINTYENAIYNSQGKYGDMINIGGVGFEKARKMAKILEDAKVLKAKMALQETKAHLLEHIFIKKINYLDILDTEMPKINIVMDVSNEHTSFFARYNPDMDVLDINGYYFKENDARVYVEGFMDMIFKKRFYQKDMTSAEKELLQDITVYKKTM